MLPGNSQAEYEKNKPSLLLLCWTKKLGPQVMQYQEVTTVLLLYVLKGNTTVPGSPTYIPLYVDLNLLCINIILGVK